MLCYAPSFVLNFFSLICFSLNRQIVIRKNAPSLIQKQLWRLLFLQFTLVCFSLENLIFVNMQVLLLCGPPGLGKTTLAHVAAKHCGYRVVEVGFPTWDTSLAFHETGQDPLYCSKGNNRYFLSEFSDIWVSMWSQINASDDRVATTLQAKILDAIQMKSVTGDKRPNCLVSTLQQDLSLMTPDWKEQICYLWTAYLHSRKSEWFVLHDIQVIDEIDGIMGGTEGKGAVDALVEMVGLKTLPCRSVKCVGLC